MLEDSIIIGGIELLVLAIALIRPIISLTSSITALDTTIKAFKEQYEKDMAKVDKLLEEHDDSISSLKVVTENHETRLNRVEGA